MVVVADKAHNYGGGTLVPLFDDPALVAKAGRYVEPEKVPTWPEAMSAAEGRCFHT